MTLSTDYSGRPARLLDIGTGCGIVALHMLMRYNNIQATGLDVQLPLLEAAAENARLLGLADRFVTLHMDVAQSPTKTEQSAHEGENFPHGSLPKASYDLALANPPYRQAHQGRLPKNRERLTALFGNQASLENFCRTASLALKQKGRFGIIFPAERLPELLSALQTNAFSISRLLNVHSRKDEPAMLSLVEAHKGVRRSLVIEPPLALHEGEHDETALTEQALAYCPLLAVNKTGIARKKTD